jgi:hypothetical protein
MKLILLPAAGLFAGLSSAAALFALREYAFKPVVPPGPEGPVGATFMQLTSHAGLCVLVAACARVCQ